MLDLTLKSGNAQYSRRKPAKHLYNTVGCPSCDWRLDGDDDDDDDDDGDDVIYVVQAVLLFLGLPDSRFIRYKFRTQNCT